MESLFLLVLSMLAMQIIPESLQNEPVFLCIDDTILQFMISHRLRLEKGEDLPSEENVFLSRKIFLFQMKRSEIIMWVSVEYSQIYLGTNVSTHM